MGDAPRSNYSMGDAHRKPAVKKRGDAPHTDNNSKNLCFLPLCYLTSIYSFRDDPHTNNSSEIYSNI